MTREEMLARKKQLDAWKLEWAIWNIDKATSQTLDQRMTKARELHSWPVDVNKAFENKWLADVQVAPIQETPKVTSNWAMSNDMTPIYSPEKKTTPIKTTPVQETEMDKITVEGAQVDLDQKKVDIKKISDEEKRAKIEADNLNADPEYIFWQIQAWLPISPEVKKMASYKQATSRLNDFNRYNWMTASQLSNEIASQWLLPWTNAYNDLMKADPQKIKTAESAAAMATLYDKEDKDTDDWQSIISKYILENFIWDTDSLKWAISESEEANRLNDTITEKRSEVDALKDQIDNAEEDILKELEWTWATSAYKNALVADRLKWLYRQYSLKTLDYNSSVWQLKQVTDDIKYEYEESEKKQTEWLKALQMAYWLAQEAQVAPVTANWTKLDDYTLYDRNTWETKRVWDVWTPTWMISRWWSTWISTWWWTYTTPEWEVKAVSTPAQHWVDSWNSWTMDIETILTKIWSSNASLPLKNEVMEIISSQWWVAWRSETDPAVEQMKAFKNRVWALIDNQVQLENVSWAIQFSPWDSLTKKKQDYLWEVQYILDSKTLQDFIALKAQWATFWALSNEELKMLQASSSLLAWRAVRDDWTITWFDMSEAKFKEELEVLKTWYNKIINSMTWAWVDKWVSKQTTPWTTPWNDPLWLF